MQLLAIVLRDQERKTVLPPKLEEPVVNVTCDCQTVPVTCPETPITLILGIFAGGIVGGALMSGASIMDISGKLRTDGIGAVEVECYRNIKAGTHVLLWYDDDDVWHEALVMFVIGGEEVILYTPDHDLYIEKIGCKGIDGPSKLRGLTDRGTLPRNLRGRAYRFRVQPTETELRSVFRQATKIAEEERRMTDLPEEIIDHSGAVRSLDAFFGGHFVRHRKSLGVSPAHGDVNSPKNAQFAHGDNVWVAAEPLGGLALRQEVSLNRETDVQCGDKTALALRQGHWVKVELIRVEDAADYSDKRRRLYGFSSPGSSHEPPPGDRAAPKKGVIEDEDNEVRTLWVDYDEHGERYKRWRDVCKESYTPNLEEKPLEGPSTALHIIKHAERHSFVVSGLASEQAYRAA